MCDVIIERVYQTFQPSRFTRDCPGLDYVVPVFFLLSGLHEVKQRNRSSRNNHGLLNTRFFAPNMLHLALIFLLREN
jgi:hypothetical protein